MSLQNSNQAVVQVHDLLRGPMSLSRRGNGRHQCLMASRIAAAVLGGYGFISAATLLMARGLPMSQDDALMSSMMLSFAAYAAIII